MKLHLTPVVLALLAAFLVASCGSVSVTKRHYKSGYHVDWSRPDHKPASPEKVVVTVNSEPIAEEVAIKAVEDECLTEPVCLEEVRQEVVADPVTSEQHQLTDMKKTSPKRKLAAAIKSIVLSPIKRAFSNLDYQNTASMQDDSRGIGALLWLLIVIFVVLWLLGLLVGGIGNAIHLLIVVALVLLLLRLLSVL